jgi:release factor glutamine methyltransferase
MTFSLLQSAAEIVDTPAGRVADLLEAGGRRLRQAGIEQPRLVTEWLAAHLLGCPRLQVYAHARDAVEPALADEFDALIARAAQNEPVQYIVGETDFMGHPIRVSPAVLIPRPETEQLVEQVLACEALWQRPEPVIADVGTGSGCILCALAARKRARYTGIDISPDALALAKINMQQTAPKATVSWQEANLLAQAAPETLDAVISNPPYIPSRDIAGLPGNVRLYEPRLALDGGNDGLHLVTRLITQARQALKPGGFIFLEIGEQQARPIKTQLKENDWQDIHVVQDLAQRDRMVWARRP